MYSQTSEYVAVVIQGLFPPRRDTEVYVECNAVYLIQDVPVWHKL